jgi:hypothetical protein
VTGVEAWTPSAQAASLNWAYLWANQPTAASYTPNLFYQLNSSGATNTVVRTGVGAYIASLPNLGAWIPAAGIVHVTAYGVGTETCKVAGWGPNGSTEQVYVQCFTRTGVPVDTYFTLTYARPISVAGPMAFLWANQPTAASYTPNLFYQFNSSGAANTVVRTGVGAYIASLPNLGAATGHVQVTAYGTGSERCKVANWSPSGSTQQVNVRCFTSTGTPVDTLFTMTYVDDINLIGGASLFGAGGTGAPGPTGAYVWANQPTTASYAPALSYQWNDFGGTNTITRSGVGLYSVQFAGQTLSEGDVQVTAYGYGSEYCKVAYWTQGAGVQVRCFSSAGVPVDTYFTVTFLSWFQGF